MNTTKWIILAAAVIVLVLLFIYAVIEVFIFAAGVVAGVIIHNNWNGIVRNVKK